MSKQSKEKNKVTDRSRSKMATVIMVVIAIIVVLVPVSIFVGTNIYINTTDQKIVTLNGTRNIQTKEDLIDELNSQIENKISYIKIKDSSSSDKTEESKDMTLDLTLDDLGITETLSEDSIKYIENNTKIEDDDIEIQFEFESDEIEKLNDTRRKSENARIVKENTSEKLDSYKEKDENTEINWFTVVESVQGNQIDCDKLYKDIKNKLGINENNKINLESLPSSSIEIDLSNYIREDDTLEITSEQLRSKLERLENLKVTYTNGYEISIKELYTYLDVNDTASEIEFKDENLEESDKEQSESLKELSKSIDKTIEIELASYDTVGNPKEFITNSGETITIKGGTYGNIFSSDLETEYLIKFFSEEMKKIQEDETYTPEYEVRTPIYSRELPDEIGDTYIEVSISDQHVWVYENGEVIMDSECVTGKLDGSHATPTGMFFISEIQNGRTLKPKGSTSGTWVNKWMRITNDGVGLHDAYWRSAFGGTIYKTGGSHGCINLPKSFAYRLFEKAFLREPVIVY
jgi:hypothetical protein